MGDRIVVRRATVAGEVRPPSDKSLTHRAIMLGSLARPGSETQITHPLDGEDCQATAEIMEAVGASRIERRGESWIVRSLGNWQSPSTPLSCGNSGTTMRLLAGICASQENFAVTLVGDESLSKRPMRRITEPLRQMGASITGDQAPLEITGGLLQGISYATPMASAQVKSCLLLAGCRAEGTTTITEPSPTRDHTERMLSALGAQLVRYADCQVSISGGQSWSGFEFRVPGDISSAAFWLVAAAIAGRDNLTISEVGLNPTRIGVLDVLQQVGVKMSVTLEPERLGEPVGSITIQPGVGLCPFVIEGVLVPRLIDEIPVLCVLATQCEGTSVIRNAEELRHKESDRIAEMAAGLTAMGADVEVFEDGLRITGPTPLTGQCHTVNKDHRIAMALAIAGLIAEGETIIDGAETIRTSYPNFEKHLHELTQ